MLDFLSSRSQLARRVCEGLILAAFVGWFFWIIKDVIKGALGGDKKKTPATENGPPTR
jgi:hypothetical protein